MIRPSVEESITAAMKILEDSILPDLQNDFAVGKCHAVIAMLGRTRASVDAIGRHLYEDNEDIEQTFAAILDDLGPATDPALVATRTVIRTVIDTTAALAAPSYLRPSELAARNAALKAALTEIVGGDGERAFDAIVGTATHQRLRDLLQRMINRDLALSGEFTAGRPRPQPAPAAS